MINPTEQNKGPAELRLVSPESIRREPIPDISKEEIASPEVQQAIKDMKAFQDSQGEGCVGVAAPQVGLELPIAVIKINLPPQSGIPDFEATIINPSYEGEGEPVEFAEGCLTTGGGDEDPVVKIPRFATIRARWTDENGVKHEEVLTRGHAAVFQHETDHIRGELITDHVNPDGSNVLTVAEYRDELQQRRQKAMGEQALDSSQS